MTDEQIMAIWHSIEPQGDPSGQKFAVAFARAILATPPTEQLAVTTQAAGGEAKPFGYVTTTRSGTQYFYPDTPYLDNAVEYVAVYRAAAPAADVEESGYICADCKAPLRAGYTCGKCGSDMAEEDKRAAAVPEGLTKECILKDECICVIEKRGNLRDCCSNMRRPASDDAKAAALQRMFPIFECLLKDAVFTGDKAGQVVADMATLKALAAAPAAQAAGGEVLRYVGDVNVDGDVTWIKETPMDWIPSSKVYLAAPAAASASETMLVEPHPAWCSGGCCNPEDAAAVAPKGVPEGLTEFERRVDFEVGRRLVAAIKEMKQDALYASPVPQASGKITKGSGG